MSKIINNPLLFGISGMLARMLVFRRFRGQVVVSNRPAKPTKLTSHQEMMKARFMASIRYAQQAMKDPAVKAEYAAAITTNKFSAFHVAQTDALTRPTVHAIDSSRYRGAAGDPIVIRATDDFKIVAVRVAITAGNGTEIERGEATPIPGSPDLWEYLTRNESTDVSQTKITATATDLPGNVTTLEHQA